MDKLALGVTRPHYVHRNQLPKKEVERLPKAKHQQKAVPVRTVQGALSRGRKGGGKGEAVKELKEWLLGLLDGARENWEQQLANRRKWVMMMRQQHREKLMRILHYIEQLRKHAYEQYRHVCSRSREEGCTDCRQRGLFFNDLVRDYLNNSSTDMIARSPGKTKQQFQAEKDKKEGDGMKESKAERPSINQTTGRHSQAGSRASQRTNSSQDHSGTSPHHYFFQSDKSKLKKPQSKFKRAENERNSDRKSDRKAEGEQQTQLAEERENGLEYRFNQGKREDTSEGKRESRLRKSSQFYSRNEDSYSRRNFEGRMDESSSRRDSKSSLRQSVLRQSGKSPFLEEFTRAQFKLIDAEEAVMRGPNGAPGRVGRFGLIRNSGLQLSEEIVERNLKKRKSGKGRNNRYIRKNSNSNEAEIDLSSSSSESEAMLKRQREEIEELIREKEYFRDDHYKKVSRYRRERMIYDILKREILLNDGIEEAPEEEQHESQAPKSTEPSRFDITQNNIDPEPALTAANKTKIKKKYSLMERKESLISKLALLNQGNTFESIRGKIEEILQERGRLVESREERGGGKNPVEKFLSQVLKITDLKRLMKEKFLKESDWSPKMREMHQFYTYLEYSMEAFRSKLNKTTDHAWRELTYDGSHADAALDSLILDPHMRQWQGLQLSTLGEEHHREIECSMKYYGIDVKRLKNLNQISYEVAANKTLNPVFSSVGQRSMKEIQEITEGLLYA